MICTSDMGIPYDLFFFVEFEAPVLDKKTY